ncbi:MAG TPA: bifunctional riboflavin kinase/FMN adenylyltransferase, partial [Terriglobales bacterium]|nr:bifunctional riboflavin kinase/FMN adenylyltransferase [Terriglobales bacterium]
MKTFHHLEDIPGDFGPTIVSVGNFDGLHRAHSRVLGEIAGRASARGAKSVAVTFEPHPMRILRPDAGLKLLTPTPDKIRLLQRTEIDAVLLLP